MVVFRTIALAALVYPLVHPLKRTDAPRIIWLVLASVPIAIDFALGYFSIWQNNHLTRVATGALLGVVAAFFVVPGVIDLSSTISRRLGHNRRSRSR